MKIYTPIGSKERFLEMFKGVNKLQLNEVATNILQTGTQLVEKAFNELRNKEAQVKQTNTQVEGDKNYVEIVTIDNEGNEITFRFRVNSTETGQDDVYNVNDADLVEFKVKSPRFNVDLPENMKAVQEFNAEHSGEIMDVVSEYANFETDSFDEELEEAVKLIDKIPYKKGTETMQTNKAYADQKPTNPDVRVKSDELDKFVNENEYADDEYTQGVSIEDPLADPTDYSAVDAAAILKDKNDDDGTKGIDPYDMVDTDYDDDEEVSAEEREMYSQAYDNLVAAGNSTPTSPQIDAEVLRIKREKGLAEPFKKNRAISKEAEPFFEELGRSIVHDMNADDAVKHGFEKTLTPEEKARLIRMADEVLSDKLGVRKFQISKEQYIQMVRDVAIQFYKSGHIGLLGVGGGLNEETEKGEYPDPIGKKFKPKNQMPKKKKRSQLVVKLSEESEIPREYWGNPEDEMNEEEVPQADDGMKLDTQVDDVEQISQEKEETGDMIAGGLADDKVAREFNPEQLAMGLKVEMEHTDNPMVALEIAMNHLMEDPEYYTRKDDPEASAQDGAAKDAEGGEDNELEDELLGYKPHNVNDYISEEFDYAAERDYHDKEDMRQHPEDYGDVNWKEFYQMAKDVNGHNPEFEKKYGNLLNQPQIMDALEKTNNYNSFLKIINPFEFNRMKTNVARDFGYEPEDWQIGITEEEGFEEYQGKIGDSYQDAEGNQFTVRDKVKGGVTLQGQGGESEIATRDIKFLKKLSEAKEEKKEIITEEQVKLARQALNKRGLTEGMTKKEAVQILIKHNIK